MSTPSSDSATKSVAQVAQDEVAESEVEPAPDWAKDPQVQAMATAMAETIAEKRAFLESLPKGNRHSKRPISDQRSWHQQEGESHKEYASFMTFLTLPAEERTLAKCAERLNRSRALMERYSAKWSWILRVSRYEEHYLLLRLDSLAADRDSMWATQQALGTKAVAIAESAMETLIGEHTSPDGKIDLAVLKPEVMVRLLAEATKLQRLATLGRVESAEKIASDNDALTDRWSDELAAILSDFTNSLNLTEQQQEQARKSILEILMGEVEDPNATSEMREVKVVRD